MDLTALNGVGVSGIFVLMLVKLFLDWNAKQQSKKHNPSEITQERRIHSVLQQQKQDDMMLDLSRLLSDNSRVMEQILEQMKSNTEVLQKVVIQTSNLLEHQRISAGERTVTHGLGI